MLMMSPMFMSMISTMSQVRRRGKRLCCAAVVRFTASILRDEIYVITVAWHIARFNSGRFRWEDGRKGKRKGTLGGETTVV